MRDAVKTLYEHWVNVHTPTAEEGEAFEALYEQIGEKVPDGPIYTALVEYSDLIQYEAFRDGILTALSLLHPLPEQEDLQA